MATTNIIYKQWAGTDLLCINTKDFTVNTLSDYGDGINMYGRLTVIEEPGTLISADGTKYDVVPGNVVFTAYDACVAIKDPILSTVIRNAITARRSAASRANRPLLKAEAIEEAMDRDRSAGLID
ncbi:MAG: hypothetical protein LC127_01795 [Chitinophagales bacterium]|nr:hypothetical protein [Chitinophagales bacterium]